MTAPLADQTASPTPSAVSSPNGNASAPSLALAAVTVGAVVWAVYFAALIAVYATAYHRKVIPCQAAAGWGLAVAVAAVLLSVPFTISWPPAAARVINPAPRVLAGVSGLLVLGSVAVIWVAVNLTIAGSTVGAWMLALCAAMTPVAVLLTRLAAPSAAPVTAHTAAVGTATVGNMTAATAVADRAAGGTETEAPAVSGAAGAVLEADARGDTATIAPRVTGNPLLAADWAERLGGQPPRVAVDKGMWDVVLGALGRRRLEVGGVALTVRVPGTLVVLGLVLPKQVKASGVFCEFRSEELGRVRDVIDGVSDILGLAPGQVVITWVHTHPGMGLFLSETDLATAAIWRAFDPEFTPIVLDPLARPVSSQIGVFDLANKKISSVRVINGLVDVNAAGTLRDELVDAYRDAEGTMVLFGAG